jgi:general secretion pathway protein C
MSQRTQMPTDKAPLVLTFSLWLLVAASATAWSLSLGPSDQRPVVSVSLPSGSGFLNTVSADGIAHLLGYRATDAVTMQAQAADPLASRLKLLGVAKAGSTQAVALIAVDGQAAKPVRRGEEVLPGWVLQSVDPEQAYVGNDIQTPPALVLPMPKRP